jgi:site-specific recombinase XerD
MKTKNQTNILASSLRGFFMDHLPHLRGMSPNTIQSYRDSFVLLLRFVASTKRRSTSSLDLDDIGPDEVLAFLNYLETERHNVASTRNVRLAALHAFFHYVASHNPERLGQSQRILGIPFKRSRNRSIDYFEYEELEAVFSTIDRSTSDGRRDYALLATMFNTGARVQEVIDIGARDIQLTKPFQVRLLGKGRKERICPLWSQTAHLLKALCTERKLDLRSGEPVFLNHRREPLTRFGVRYILAKYFQQAKDWNPNLARKKLHPHTIRHSTAVHLLKAGVDMVTISHWLGHTSINTTNKYVAIDLEQKQKAVARAKPLGSHSMRKSAAWRRDTKILDWLEAL